MGMVIQHNMTAANANRNLGVTAGNLAKSTEKLSSGYKINRAGDNAAGLAISEKMRGQIRGLDQASTNSEDGISMIQTAEGALTETHSILQRMRELAVQASSDTNTDDDRTQIQNEIDQLTEEVDRIANTTEFNTKKLLDGSRQGSVNEKAGSANVDSTFGNSNVSASITKDGSAKAAFTDVIRIEITEDFSVGKSTKGTSKLSEADIDKINSLITSDDTVSLDTVLQATAGVAITNSNYSANKSTQENIDSALSAAKSALITEQSNAATAASNVTSNSETIDKTIQNVMKYVEATKQSTGETILKTGVTEDDIKAALTNYVDALVKDGKSADGVADGTSDDITAAMNALNDLFTDSGTIAEKGVASADITEQIKDGAGSAVAVGQVASVATTNTLATIGGRVATSLAAYAGNLAGAQIHNNEENAKVAQIQTVVDTLSNKDLANAIVDYKKALTDQSGLAAGASDALKQEKADAVAAAKDKLDKLNSASSVMTVTDLFGNTEDSAKFEIGSKVEDDNTLSITLKNKEGDDTVITISNADKMKAGDVITIKAQEMVESKQAATGKEAFRLQVGANAGQEVALGINSMKSKDLNIVQTKEGKEGKALDVTSQASASLAIDAYDMAIQQVSTERAKMGAVQNRLEHTIANLDTSAENLQSAESSLRDTDMAEEMTKYSKSNILQQAGQSMLAQANQSTQGVLSLLG